MLTRADVVPAARALLDAAGRLPREHLTVRRFRMAGLVVEVAFGSGGLEPAYSARMGLPVAIDTRPPDLRFFVLNAADLGMAAVPAWGDAGWGAASLRAAMAAAGLMVEHPWRPNVWRFFDRVAGFGLLLVNTPADLPVWDGGAPLVDLVRPALWQRDIRVVHAATLGAAGRGILLVGDGGAGKSGTTLAGIAAGLQTVGDDYVAVAFEDERPVVRLLYRMMKQDRTGLARHAGHPVAEAPGEPTWHGKIEFAPADYFPGCLTERLALAAVVIPEIGAPGEAPEISRARAGEALRVAMRTNLFTGAIDEGMRFFARLLRLPCYRMKLVADAEANGAALARFVAGLPDA